MPKVAPGQLTDKQRAFVTHYVATGNATESARLAGFKVPNHYGPTLVKQSQVKAAIDALRAETTAATIASKQECEERLSVMLRNSSLSPKDHREAMKLLSQLQGWMVQRHEVSGPHQGPVQLQSVPTTELVGLLEKSEHDQ